MNRTDLLSLLMILYGCVLLVLAIYAQWQKPDKKALLRKILVASPLFLLPALMLVVHHHMSTTKSKAGTLLPEYGKIGQWTSNEIKSATFLLSSYPFRGNVPVAIGDDTFSHLALALNNLTAFQPNHPNYAVTGRLLVGTDDTTYIYDLFLDTKRPEQVDIRFTTAEGWVVAYYTSDELYGVYNSALDDRENGDPRTPIADRD